MGGKKKAKKAPPKVKAPRLSIYFTCPSCNVERAVNGRLDTSSKIGTLTCTKCSASFKCPIKSNMTTADCYVKWIDEFERVNQEAMDNLVDADEQQPAKRPRVEERRGAIVDSDEEGGDEERDE